MVTQHESTELKMVSPRPDAPDAVAAGQKVSARADWSSPSAAGTPSQLPRSVISPEVARTWDRLFNAAMAKGTAGLDPRVILLAYLDWWVKLAWSPGTHARLTEKALRKWARIALFLAQYISDREPDRVIEPLPQDKRFRDPAWRQWPYNLFSQSFLLTQQWWANATMGVPALSREHKDMVTFVTRQLLDMASPSNFAWTNPEVRQATLREGGANLVRGWQNFVDDWKRGLTGQKPSGAERFEPGKSVAMAPGKVVYRNHLIELIQYAPTTSDVYAEPVLIVPAWIMKYYILDLSPHNSLVRYLVGKGHTVFMISWRNPTEEDRDLGMDDYRRLGVLAALDAVGHIVPDTRVHAVGYCLGGTLLAIAAAALARDHDQRLQTITLLAAQTDFTEAGELMLFMNEAQVSFLESMMWERGILDTQQMSGAFQMLRSNDLIWSRMVRDYLLGERRPPNDLMSWNADQTRLPYRMHSEYMRELFLNNSLAEGHYRVDGRSVAISDIRIPIFAIGTETDHVAPWKSVYKINLLADSQEVTFLLTSGGHNAGIVSEPGHRGRSYRISSRTDDQPYVDPETWYERTLRTEGSWWLAWQQWLVRYSTANAAPPPMGAPDAGFAILGDAPGTYVHQA